MTEDEVLDLFGACSNRGRWGPEDELGTLNFITPTIRQNALATVRHGRSVGFGLELNNGLTDSFFLRAKGDSAGYRSSSLTVAIDRFSLAAHGFSVTHLDAIGHASFEGLTYNQRSAAAAMSPRGLRFGGIEAMRDGIVTRGVLLDVASARHVAWLQPTDSVTVADLEAAETETGLRVSSGDAVLVRIGLGARLESGGSDDPARRAGLAPECIPWLHRRQVAVYGGDCIEQIPSGYPRVPMPLHQIGLAAMGLTLLDCANVEVLRAAVREAGRSEFLLICAPLNIRGGTASPVNPIAVF